MCNRICLLFFFQSGRQGLGNIDVAAHHGAVTCVTYPLDLSFFGPAGAISLLYGAILNVVLVNPTQFYLVAYCKHFSFESAWFYMNPFRLENTPS